MGCRPSDEPHVAAKLSGVHPFARPASMRGWVPLALENANPTTLPIQPRPHPNTRTKSTVRHSAGKAPCRSTDGAARPARRYSRGSGADVPDASIPRHDHRRSRTESPEAKHRPGNRRIGFPRTSSRRRPASHNCTNHKLPSACPLIFERKDYEASDSAASSTSTTSTISGSRQSTP